MTNTDITRLMAEVSSKVSPAGVVEARHPIRVAARELTIEFQLESYPEVADAFVECARITGIPASLVRYRVDRDTEESASRVTATMETTTGTTTVSAVGPDVVAASVHAFVAGVDA